MDRRAYRGGSPVTCPLARTASARHVYTYHGEAIFRFTTGYRKRAVYRCACGKIKRGKPLSDKALRAHVLKKHETALRNLAKL